LIEHVAGSRKNMSVTSGLPEDLDRELVPRGTAAAGHVVDAVVVAVEQPHEAGGEMTGVGGAADLVTDHDHLVLGVREPEHRVDEVTAVHAEEPGRANDEVTLVRSRRLLLPGER